MTGIRLVLPITTAGGVALPDSDVDQRAVGWSSAGGALRPCQVPHVVCLEVGFKICQFATEIWFDFSLLVLRLMILDLQSTGPG